MAVSDKQVHLLYRFEEQQHIRFEVYDVDTYDPSLEKQDFLGRCETTLGQVRFCITS
jgi:hypothetical protein